MQTYNKIHAYTGAHKYNMHIAYIFYIIVYRCTRVIESRPMPLPVTTINGMYAHYILYIIYIILMKCDDINYSIFVR